MNTEERIINSVLSNLNLTLSDIQSKRRFGNFVDARRIITGLLRQSTKLTLKQIGMRLGNIDHSSVLYLKDSFDDLKQTDKAFRDMVIRIIETV